MLAVYTHIRSKLSSILQQIDRIESSFSENHAFYIESHSAGRNEGFWVAAAINHDGIVICLSGAFILPLFDMSGAAVRKTMGTRAGRTRRPKTFMAETLSRAGIMGGEVAISGAGRRAHVVTEPWLCP